MDTGFPHVPSVARRASWCPFPTTGGTGRPIQYKAWVCTDPGVRIPHPHRQRRVEPGQGIEGGLQVGAFPLPEAAPSSCAPVPAASGRCRPVRPRNRASRFPAVPGRGASRREPRTPPKTRIARARGPGVHAQRKAVNKQQFGDLGMKLGAVLLACLVWFYAATELNYRTELEHPSAGCRSASDEVRDPHHRLQPGPRKGRRSWFREAARTSSCWRRTPCFCALSRRSAGRVSRGKFRLVPEQVVSKTELARSGSRRSSSRKRSRW